MRSTKTHHPVGLSSLADCIPMRWNFSPDIISESCFRSHYSSTSDKFRIILSLSKTSSLLSASITSGHHQSIEDPHPDNVAENYLDPEKYAIMCFNFLRSNDNFFICTNVNVIGRTLKIDEVGILRTPLCTRRWLDGGRRCHRKEAC